MKKKILFILHIPPPVNGAAMVGQFIKESTRINTNFETDYINLTTSFSLDKIGKGGFQKISAVFKILKQVYKALKNFQPDLCYVTLTAKGFGFYKDTLVVLLLKIFNKNIIYHFHNKGVSINSNSIFKKKLYQFVFKDTKSILLSPILYYDIKSYVDKQSVYFCPNGIPLIDDYEAISNNMEKIYGVCNFLFLSNMMEEKGVYILLEACKILKQENANFQCHFIGAWSDVSENDFYNKVAELDIQNVVQMHGKQYGEDKLNHFKNADVFVFPTFYNNECFPLVLLEAMQAGLPIISTKEGAIAEMVVNDLNGFTVEQNNAKALARKMSFYSLNPEKRIDMGTKGRIMFEKNYTLNKFENNLSHILLNEV